MQNVTNRDEMSSWGWCQRLKELKSWPNAMFQLMLKVMAVAMCTMNMVLNSDDVKMVMAVAMSIMETRWQQGVVEGGAVQCQGLTGGLSQSGIRWCYRGPDQIGKQSVSVKQLPCWHSCAIFYHPIQCFRKSQSSVSKKHVCIKILSFYFLGI